ncbi:MAG: hypothetical protein ABJD13_07750 [Paracoccaceae bacterium]
MSQYIFETIEAAQEQAAGWLRIYNNERPNMGIVEADWRNNTENKRVYPTVKPH